MRRRAFTLIELLVVISIIALLVGILLPALGKARIAAQKMVDLSNMRQIGIGATAYAADNNGMAPHRGGFGNGDTPYISQREGAVTGSSVWGGEKGQTLPEDNNFMSLGPLLPAGADAELANYPAGEDPQFGNYLTIEALYAPQQQNNENPEDSSIPVSFWNRRSYFGDQLRIPWDLDGSQWVSWFSGRNYYFPTSYAWRGADYSFLDEDLSGDPNRLVTYQHETPGTYTYGGYTQEAITQNRIRAVIDHPDFADNVVMTSSSTTILDPANPQVDYLLGDGSAGNIGDDEFIASLSTTIEWYGNFSYMRSRYPAMVDQALGN